MWIGTIQAGTGNVPAEDLAALRSRPPSQVKVLVRVSAQVHVQSLETSVLSFNFKPRAGRSDTYVTGTNVALVAWPSFAVSPELGLLVGAGSPATAKATLASLELPYALFGFVQLLVSVALAKIQVPC